MTDFKNKLSIITGIPVEKLEEEIDKSNKNYRKTRVLVNNKYRMFFVPPNLLKVIQGLTLELVFSKFEVSPESHAYIKNRSIKSNVLAHKANRYFYKTDIESFFPSIKVNHIRKVLLNSKEISEVDIDFILKIVAPFENLDLGSVSSPMISNVVFTEFDSKLKRELSTMKNDFVFTRYSDDITISSKTDFNPVEVTNIIKKILNEFDMKINYKKTSYLENKGSLKITGIFLLKNGCITVGTNFKRKLKHNIHLLINGKECQFTNHQIIGMLAFVKDIEPDYYNKLVIKYSTNRSLFECLGELET